MGQTTIATQKRKEWLLQNVGKGAAERPTMVAAFRRDEDRRELGRIVGPCQWKLIWSKTCAAAIEAARRSAAPIVISGQTFPDGGWRDIWNRLRKQCHPPMFILACGSPMKRCGWRF